MVIRWASKYCATKERSLGRSSGKPFLREVLNRYWVQWTVPTMVALLCFPTFGVDMSKVNREVMERFTLLGVLAMTMV